MSFGDHLEELRRRVIYALIGLVITVVICFRFGGRIIETLATPYVVAMQELDQDARLVQLNPIESFLEYFKICLEFGLVLAAPWILYQIWMFVAAGLYPSERRVVQYFAPASIGLFFVGASFMVLIVLAGLMRFLIQFSTLFPLPGPDNAFYRWLMPDTPMVQVASSRPAAPSLHAPILADDPPHPSDGDVWINARTHRLKVHHNGETFYALLQSDTRKQFVQPFFRISEYLGFVVNMALAFGLGFQVPIVVIFLIAVGIVPAKNLSAARKYVVLCIFIAAAVITPTPDAWTMLLLAGPMWFLFEVGLFIGRMIERRAA